MSRFRSRALAVVLSFAFAIPLVAQTTQAQTPVPANQASSKNRIVGFRALEWKSVASNSQAQAETTIATLKKLGCEVKTDGAGANIKISFRCPNWRSMKLDTDSLVNQWVMWCGAQGMETVTVNPPSNTRKPTVKFRLATPKTVHLHDMDKAKKIVNTLSLIGCNVKTADHDGHIDATFVAANWITLELQNEDSAHAWQKWLDESGFETEHEHVAENMQNKPVSKR